MKKILYSKDAPKPIGPYSQGIETANLVFISGQLGIDPLTSNLANDVQLQTERALKNIQAILQMANLTFENIVKTTIFLINMDDFDIVNSIYSKYFIKDYPARSTIQVSKLPKDALIEIELIAEKKNIIINAN